MLGVPSSIAMCQRVGWVESWTRGVTSPVTETAAYAEDVIDATARARMAWRARRGGVGRKLRDSMAVFLCRHGNRYVCDMREYGIKGGSMEIYIESGKYQAENQAGEARLLAIEAGGGCPFCQMGCT
jgi:hypothetical protein